MLLPTPRSRPRPRRRLAPLAGTTLVLLLAASLALGHAAALGGMTARRLTAFTVTSAPSVPSVLAATDFTAPNGTNLTADVLDTGQQWTVHAGTWRIDGNQAGSTASTSLANASVDVGTTSAAVQAAMAFPTGNRRAGLTFLDDGTNRLYVVVSNQNGGRVQVYKHVSGSSTLLAETNGLGQPATAVLRVEVFTNTINVYFAGAFAVGYTLTPAEVAMFKAPSHDGFGLIADSDRTTSYDDFLVVAP